MGALNILLNAGLAFMDAFGIRSVVTGFFVAVMALLVLGVAISIFTKGKS